MSNDFPELLTNEVLLRRFVPADLDFVYSALSDPEVIRFYGVEFHSREEAKKQLEWFADLEKNGTGIWWAICSPHRAAFYGAVGLYYLKPEHQKAEIGFWLLKEFWGKGLMSASVELALAYGFNQLNLHRIEAFVETENYASKKILKRLNFDFEGTMKHTEIKKDHFISLDIYARLNTGNPRII